ncbi:TPA: TIGR04255 family protein [Vibrio parahaemolyticus]|nr:TIGR04255 family protein [Vibrio parahaemolyticus]MDG2680602.1 TIGR04255 family protein [Vibrio parahaemolyticus]
MSIKYKNPPVVYAVAKISFRDSIGTFDDDKYLKLRDETKKLGFEAFTKSSVVGVQLKQSRSDFIAQQTDIKRFGYFNAERDKSFLIDDNSIELRVSKYTNHSDFLECFIQVLQICFNLGIAKGNQQRELELHYVDIFAPSREFELQDMFNQVNLPNNQFYSNESDSISVGSLSFIRVLEDGRQKVEVNLEHINLKNINGRKYLPDALIEPDSKLGMPLYTDRLFEGFYNKEYAIAHTACSSLFDENTVTLEMRHKLEDMYKESRKTFDHMIKPESCNIIWSIEEQ